MIQNRKILVTLVGLIVLLTSIAAPAAPFDSAWVKGLVLNKLGDWFGHRLEVEGEIAIDLSLTPRLRAERVRVANPPWSAHPYMIELAVLEVTIDLGKFLSGSLVLPELYLTEPRVLLEVSEQGKTNWQSRDAAPSSAGTESDQPNLPDIPQIDKLLPRINKLRINDGWIRYLSHVDGTDIKANIATVSGHNGEDEWRLNVDGTLQERLLALTLESDAMSAARRTQIELKARFGNSDLAGSVSVDNSSPRPKITADLHAQRVDAAQLGAVFNQDRLEQKPDEPVLTDLTRLQQVNGHVVLTIDTLFTTEQTKLSNLGLDLRLNDGQLVISPLESTLGDNRFHLTGSLDVAKLPASGGLTLELDRLELRTLRMLGIEQPPPGILAGEIVLDITGQLPTGRDNLRLPGLGRIEIAPSRLRYTAPKLDIDLRTTLRSRTANGRQRLFAKVDGRYRGESFDLDFSGDSPLALRDPDNPYGLDLKLQVVDTTIEIAGHLLHPLQLTGLDLSFAIAGPNPELLTPLIVFPLPELPPYSIKGHLNREGDTIKLNNFAGRVGDSDASGDLRVKLGGEKPVIYATVNSQTIDLDDLAGLIGGTPKADPGETVSPGQRREELRAAQNPYLLPREPIDIDRVAAAMEGAIEFRGKRVETKVPLDDLHFRFEVDNDRIRLNPLNFGVGGGEVHSKINFDTNPKPAEGTVESEIRRVNMKKVLAPLEIADDSAGILGGQLKVWIRGDTVADFFASADGGLFLLMTDGKLDVLLTEIAGIDIGETLMALIGNFDAVPIDCAYLDLHAEDGIAHLETAVIDTRDTLFLADGFIDFNQELIDLVVEPRPKDFSLFSFRSPLNIEGRLKAPSFYPGEAFYARAITSAVLAAVAPPVALLPLIEPGTGEEPVYCQGLIKAIDRVRTEDRNSGEQ